MIDKSTKQRIIDYLQKHQHATTEELSKAFGMTRANILYHLQTLEHNQIIEVVLPVPHEKRTKGRPSFFYQLTSSYSPDNIDHLATALFYFSTRLREAHQEKEDFFLMIAEEMFPSTAITAYTSLAQKMQKVVFHLNLHHYDAQWEVHREGPHIMIRNCPYRKVREAIPDICLLDKAILENLLGRNVRQIDTTDFSQPEITNCRFAVS